jgi:LAO/AO transport system kinase
VLRTVALTGEGIPELIGQIEQHRCFLESNVECKTALLRTKTETELVEAIRERVTNSVIEELKRKGEFDELVHEIMERQTDPTSAARRLLKRALKNET